MRYLFAYGLLCFCFACGSPSVKKQSADSTITTGDDSAKIIQSHIEQSPDSARLYDQLINRLTQQGKFAEAAAWCDRLLKRGADSNYYYWFIKGDIFRHGQMFDSAIACYQTYLQKFPDDEQIFLNLANTYAEAGNKDAVDLSNMIAARFPTREMRSEAAFIKGVYYNTVKQYSEARRWLDSAIIFNYNYAEAYMEKGYSFYDEKKFGEAEKTFAQLTEINRNYADAWYWLAKSEEAGGRNKQAIVNYEQALAIDSSIQEATAAIRRLQGTNAKP